MEISERELRLLAADVDAHHRDGLATLADDLRELHAETRARRATTRRDLFRKGGAAAGALVIGGTAFSLAGLLPAAAQEDDESPEPVLDDNAIAAFAESLELTAVEAYGRAVASGLLAPAVAQVAQSFAGHHAEHATAFAALSGGTAKGEANAPLLRAVGDQLRNAHDDKAVLRIALDLENAAAATYLYALGVLESKSRLQLAASILPVESQHAAVISLALGDELETVVPTFENQDRAVDPVLFPVEPTTTTTTSTTTK